MNTNLSNTVYGILLLAILPLAIYCILFLIHFSFQPAGIKFADRTRKASKLTRKNMATLYWPFQLLSKFFNELWMALKSFSFSRFFQWSGGVDLKVMENQPSPVKTERVQFGRTMWVVNIISGILLGHVAGDIYHSTWVGVGASALWFLAVWMIDRQYVKMADKHGSKAKKAMTARKVMVITFGILNASFVMLAIFHTEINKVIHHRIEAERKLVMDSTDLVLTDLLAQQSVEDQLLNDKSMAFTNWSAEQEQQIANKRSLLDSRRDSLIGEIEGVVGSGKRGDGIAAGAKRQSIAADSAMLVEMQARFDTTKYQSPTYMALQQQEKIHDQRVLDIQKQIVDQKNLRDAKIVEINNTAQDGYVDQLTALLKVAVSSPIAFLFILIVFVAFIYLEGFVVFSKSLSEVDSYQAEIRLLEEKYKVDKLNSTQIEIAKANTELANQLNTYNGARTAALVHGEAEFAKNSIALFAAQKTRLEALNNHLLYIESLLNNLPIMNETEKNIFRSRMVHEFMTAN